MAEWRIRERRSSPGRPSSPRENERGDRGSWGARGGSYAASRDRRSPSPVWSSRRTETGGERADFSVRNGGMRSRGSDGGDGPRRPGESVRWPAGNPRRTESGLRRRDSVEESVARTGDVSEVDVRRVEGERSPRAVDDVRRSGNVRSLAPGSSDGGYGLADTYHRSFDTGSRMHVRGVVGSLRRDSPPRRRRDDSSLRRRSDDSPPRRLPDDSPPRRRSDDSPPRRRPDDSPPRRRPDDSPPRRRPDGSPPRRRPDGSPPRRRPDGSPPRRRPDDRPLPRDVDIGTLGGDSSYATDDLSRPSVEERVVRRTEDRPIWSQSDRHVRNAAAAERFLERPLSTDEYERHIESPIQPTQSLQQQIRERRVDSHADPPVGDTWQARESVAGIGPKLGRIDPRHSSGDYRNRRLDVATGTGPAYRVERADRTSDADDFEPNYVPEKKIRLDPSDLSPHHPDEYIAVDRRVLTDSKAGAHSSRERRAPFEKEWRSPKQAVDVFHGRSREQSTEDVKRSYSRQPPRSDSRHIDKTIVRTDRFDRGSMHSLPAVAVQQDSMRDPMRADGRYRSMSPTTAAPRSPPSGDHDFKIVPDVYEGADTVHDLDFADSGRTTRNAEHDDRSRPRSSLANRHDSDTIKRAGRNRRDAGPASPQRNRRAGIDLREEVLGGRRYRGMEAAVVQDVASPSAPDRVGDFPMPNVPLNNRSARPELPGFVRPPLKRSRSSSVGRSAIHRTTPVASREVTASARVGTTRQKYVIERTLSEEERIRSVTRGLRPDDFASNQEIDRSIQQLWTGFCRRMLDMGAVPLKHLKLEYLNAYFDVLKSTYPHFAEYYRVCKQQLLGSSDSYSPVEKKRVHSVETNRARHLPPTSKTFEHGRAALLLKRAKEQKLAVYRSSASTKTAELESTFSGVPHRDMRSARQQAMATAPPPRRPFSSAAAATTTRHGNIRPATGNVVRLVAGRGNDGGKGESAIVKSPATRSSKMQPPSAQDGGATSDPIDSGRTSTVSGSTAAHATGSKSTRPSPKESESQLSDNAPDRLQGASLVAVADAAAATSGKAVFDDPFMKFLHTTLTAMIVIGELQRQQISGRLTAHHSKSLADERAKMEERMRTDMGHRLIKLARYIQHGDLSSAREALSISENVLNTVANLDPVVIRTIACTPLLR